MAANAEVSKQAAADITSLSQKENEQLQQLVRRLLGNINFAVDAHADSEEDLNTNFAGVILCTHAGVNKTEWILDLGATDHIAYFFDQLIESKTLQLKSSITLPNGHTSDISSIGKVKLSNDLVLQDVLYLPDFKYNLLSVPQLTRHSNCIVIFFPNSV